MIYNAINNLTNDTLRRFASMGVLALLPLLVIVSFVIGTGLHLYHTGHEYFSDLKHFIVHDIIDSARDLYRVAKTGGTL